MAESFVNNVFNKFSSFVLEKVFLAWNVRNDLQKLSKTSTSIEEFLWSNADQQQQQAKSCQDEWHEKMEDIFYDADDVLDEFQIELSKPQVFQGSISTKVRCFFSRSNPLAFRFKIAHKIKEINQRIAEIPCLQTESNDLAMQRGDRHAIHREREMTHSFILDSDVIGRDEDKERIVKILMQLSDHENVSVIPIVGIGGLGKTTLAKIVYNHKKIGELFNLKMWVCVSNDFNFNLKRMIEKILKSATNGENFDHLDIEELQNKIRETLNQKRFLLILDDIWNWNEEVAKWEEFRSLLTGAANGSKIIVTTRSKSVALAVGTCPAYNLELLNDDKCLSIFLKWAFRNRSQEMLNPKLVEIGKRIVRKCKGVPLAVRTLGCMLYSKTHERQWLSVLESEIWKLKQKDDDILPALRLSYNDLEPTIKRCFAYCSIFPKDCEMNTYQLIQMWTAQGLIKLEDDSDQTQELEDVGMDYFRTLCSKSFFQDVKDHGYIFAFKMHDLLHDLALSVAQTKHSNIKSPAQKVSKNVQHVSFYDSDSPADELLIPLREKKKVRSIYFQFNRVKPVERSFVETCISRFEFLRLLDLRESCFEALPSSIGGLKHLRCLDLAENRSLKSLPDSLCELLCLQSLILAGCVKLEKLPRDFRNLTNLRFLYLTTQQRCFSKKGIGSLTSLRVLWITECGNLEYFFVDDDDDDDGSPLQCLAGLRTLLIKDCERLLCLPRLRYLTSIEKLVISNCENLDLMMADEGEMDVLRSLQFFAIEQVPKLVALPQWLQGASETLNHIMIEDCLNFTTLPEWMKNLIFLQKLEVSGCQRLTSLPEFTFSLREIRISLCPELIRECQRETGKDWQKITCVPDIYLDNIKI